MDLRKDKRTKQKTATKDEMVGEWPKHGAFFCTTLVLVYYVKTARK